MTDLEPGDLLFTRSKGLTSTLIQAGERRRYYGWAALIKRCLQVLLGRHIPDEPPDPCWGNHIAVYVGDGMLIEALANGLTLTPLSHYEQSQYIRLPLTSVRPTVSAQERQALLDFAHAQLSRHDTYGWWSIVSIVVQLITPWKLDISWDGAVICSAFGAQCWEHSGVTLPTRSTLTTMPADLYAFAYPNWKTAG